MPRKAIDYSNCLIYKIVCKDLGVPNVYVGHTTDFTNRKRRHKGDCYNEDGKGYNHRVYKCIRENGGWDNWTMLVIEKYDCKDNIEASMRERHWQEELNADLNHNRAYITREEKKETDRLNSIRYNEEHPEYRKSYYENNKDHIKELMAKYKDKIQEEITCDCGTKVCHGNRNKHYKSNKHLKYVASIK
jgi:hypothetical protein